jgi:hypothetical protein
MTPSIPFSRPSASSVWEAAADHFAIAELRLGQLDGRRHQSANFERLLDEGLDARDIKGLHEVIESAELHGLDCGVAFAAGGHKDDGQPFVDFADAVEKLEAGNAGEEHIEEQDVGFVLAYEG